MRFTDTLPQPPADMLQHSGMLADQIRAVIHQQGGSISFREFMRMALYEPGLGYYVSGMRKIGAGGDFITAPEISSLFSACLANQCAQVLTELGGGDILELGAGSGRMAVDILSHLETIGCLPERYLILDVSPELRDRQRQNLQAHVPHLLTRVSWLDSLPEQPLRGVIVGNEVLDAMPVELFSLKDEQLAIIGVKIQEDGFAFTEQPTTDSTIAELATLQAEVLQPALQQSGWPAHPSPYTSEFNPALSGWMRSIADTLQTGVILLIDYGYEQSDYYHPQRSQGTLICHYQHRVHDNPLIYPGLQDITASVDFTAVAQAGVQSDLELSGYTTQAAFLADNGLEALFIHALQQQPADQYKLAQQVRLLSLPAEMGERFKVIAFSKAFTPALQGFRLADRSHRL